MFLLESDRPICCLLTTSYTVYDKYTLYNDSGVSVQYSCNSFRIIFIQESAKTE